MVVRHNGVYMVSHCVRQLAIPHRSASLFSVVANKHAAWCISRTCPTPAGGPGCVPRPHIPRARVHHSRAPRHQLPGLRCSRGPLLRAVAKVTGLCHTSAYSAQLLHMFLFSNTFRRALLISFTVDILARKLVLSAGQRGGSLGKLIDSSLVGKLKLSGDTIIVNHLSHRGIVF